MSFFKRLEDKLNKEVKEQLDDINQIIQKGENMEPINEKLGTKNLEKIIESLSEIVTKVLVAVKDGITVTDALIIPTIIMETVSIIDKSKDATDEFQDLSIQEISFLIGVLANDILKVFVNTTVKG